MLNGHISLRQPSPLTSYPPECEDSEVSSGEAEVEAELEPLEASDPEDARDLHPGALLLKASLARNLPVMAEALAHRADVNTVSEEDDGKSALIYAVTGVRTTTASSSTDAQNARAYEHNHTP